MELKTPLYDCHVALGGKIVPFAGYLLPVQYPSGVIAEHMAVRKQAGLFDVSHMGEVIFSGPDALKNLNYLMTNDFTNMAIGKVRYSPMCNETGGCVDDLIVYKLGEESYLVVVNAANRHKDVAWMKAHAFGDVKVEDISDTVAQLALQGPRSHEIMLKLGVEGSLPTKYYTFKREVVLAGMRCLVSQTGYTGEAGYEIYLSNEDAPRMWNALLQAGEGLGLIPCGLGARDTLRLEAAMPLYGHEMDDTIDPIETGLGFAVKMGKDFIGRDAIAAKGTPVRQRVGLRMTGRGIAREHQDIYCQGQLIGHTTSGTHCPYLGQAVAMALVDAASSQVGTAVEVDIRGRKVGAEIVPLPFYKRA
nr:glycine cleavage system aminomethyltransferase GcvT [bacterium]